MAVTVLRALTEAQVSAYHREGYLAVPDVIDRARVKELRAVTDEFVERSRALSGTDEVLDLDPRHTVAAPTVRRIKNPADNHPLYRWVAFDSPIPDIVADLIGPDVKFHHSKLNLKGSHSAVYGRIVRGESARYVRREAGELRMPPDWSGGYTSIYALQERASRG